MLQMHANCTQGYMGQAVVLVCVVPHPADACAVLQKHRSASEQSAMCVFAADKASTWRWDPKATAVCLNLAGGGGPLQGMQRQVQVGRSRAQTSLRGWAGLMRPPNRTRVVPSSTAVWPMRAGGVSPGNQLHRVTHNSSYVT